MKATELRIGNWIERNDSQFYQITIDDLIYLSKGEDIIRIHPIQITTDILLRSGFVQYGPQDIPDRLELEYAPNGLDIYDEFDKFHTFQLRDGILKCYYNREYYIWESKYFHKLQNFLFEITGEEIIFK
jgi:hypothetical protein